MAEQDRFERRLADALLAYADEMPTLVDASAVAERVSVERTDRWRLGRRLSPRLAWVLVWAALLIVALLGAGLLAGTWRLDMAPRIPLRPGGVEMLPTARAAYDQVVVDGSGDYWAIGAGHLVRFDPETGDRTTWTVGNDPAFGGLVAGPAASGGVWVWSPAEGLRRFDGTGFRETMVPADDGAAQPTGAWRAPPHPALQVGADGTPWWSSPVWHWDGAAWISLPGQPSLDPGGSRQVVIGRGGTNDVWVGDSYFGWGASIVAHFDGRGWTATRFEDVARIVLAAPADGPPRAATSDGRFLRFDAGAWIDDPGPGFGVWDLAVDADGGVWAVSDDATSAALARYDGDGWATVVRGHDSAGSATGRLSLTPAGTFLPTSLGLMRLAGDAWEPAWPDPPTGPRTLDVIAPVSRDETWVADGELWHFAAGRWDSVPIPAEIVPVGTAAGWIGVGTDGTVWVAGDGGIAGRRDGEWRVVVPIGASHSVGIDANGMVWASGATDGKIAVVSPDSDVPLRWIGCAIGPSMAVGSDGWVDVAGETGLGAVVGDGCEWLDVLGGGRPYESNGVIAGSAGRLLASVGDTTRLFDGVRWTVVDAQPFGTGTNPTYVFDGQANLWRLPYDPSGAIPPMERFDGQGWVTVAPDHPWAALTAIRYGSPDWLSITPDGTLWFGGPSGVGRIPMAD